ncbi:MAG: single-stranded-DNA-specific exonuclease RecJ, partial [bacterium]
MSTKWIYNQHEEIPNEIKNLCNDDIFAKLLLNRGITTLKKAKEFLEPEKNCKEISPYAFSDMNKVVERISKAIATEEKIVIFGDFDADGVTATSVLYKTLQYLGANVDFYIPDRAIEGHGLNSKALIILKTKHKAKLIITVDCGISNIAEIKLMKTLGVDIIVTDHHEAGDELPEAFAIINPKAQNSLKETLNAQEIESLNYLAGVGIAYKIACALLEKYGKLEFKQEILPFVAIGTIADVVPLLEENRLLVRLGIQCIRKACPKGIKALVDLAGYNIDTFDAQSIAFGIAPRVNAIGRLEHASKVVELFTTDNIQQIEINAKYMDDCNKIRQALCEGIFEEALAKISKEDLKNNKAIILAAENWHIGIIGIVASKLCEKFYRPVFIIRIEEDNIRCSARSIEGLNLYDTLCEVETLLGVFGGHSMAAGFSADRNNLGSVVSNIHKVVNENLQEEFMTPRIRVEEDLRQSDLTLDFVKKLQLLEPCGAKNPSPLFSIKDLAVKEMKTMGSNSNHLKVFFEGELGVLEGVFWGKSEINAKVADKVDVVFSPKVNTFMDKTTIQLELCDYRSEAKSACAPKVVDHRKKDNAIDMFLNYLKTTKTSVAIFAENQKTLEFLGEKNLANAIVINRLNAQEVDQLVFLDLPPDKNIFLEIIQKTSSKVVHIIGNSFDKKDSF